MSHRPRRRPGGEPGPYILSDLRWARGPLHLRYGGVPKLGTHAELLATAPQYAELVGHWEAAPAERGLR